MPNIQTVYMDTIVGSIDKYTKYVFLKRVFINDYYNEVFCTIGVTMCRHFNICFKCFNDTNNVFLCRSERCCSAVIASYQALLFLLLLFTVGNIYVVVCVIIQCDCIILIVMLDEMVLVLIMKMSVILTSFVSSDITLSYS